MTVAMMASNSRPRPLVTSELANETASITATSQPPSAVHMKRPIFTDETGTPRFRAASALPPEPKIQLPNLVRSSTQVARAVISSHQTTDTEYTPPILLPKMTLADAKSLALFRLPIVVSPVSARVTPMVTPCRMKKVPSVTMKDGSLVQTTTRPFRKPTTSAKTAAQTMPNQIGKPYSPTRSAITMPEAPIIV